MTELIKVNFSSRKVISRGNIGSKPKEPDLTNDQMLAGQGAIVDLMTEAVKAGADPEKFVLLFVDPKANHFSMAYDSEKFKDEEVIEILDYAGSRLSNAIAHLPN